MAKSTVLCRVRKFDSAFLRWLFILLYSEHNEVHFLDTRNVNTHR